MNHVTHPLISADFRIYSLEISKFDYIKKIKIYIAFWYVISNYFKFS